MSVPTSTAIDPELQWKLDLARSPERVLDRARGVARRNTAALAAVAAAVWAYDVVRVALA